MQYCVGLGLFPRMMQHLCTSVCVYALLVFVFVDIEAKGIHAQPQLRSLLVFDLKVVDSVHLQVLGDFKILHHGVLSRKEDRFYQKMFRFPLLHK